MEIYLLGAGLVLTMAGLYGRLTPLAKFSRTKDLSQLAQALISGMGYQVKEVLYSGQREVEIIAVKNGVDTLVQVKNRRRPLPSQLVVEASQVAETHGCLWVVLITNAKVDKRAHRTARLKGVTILGPKWLVRELKKYQRQ